MTPPLPRLAAWLLRVSVPERWAGSVYDDFEAEWQQRFRRRSSIRQRAAITFEAAVVAIRFWREWLLLTGVAVHRDVIDAIRGVWRRPRHAIATGAVIAAGVGINTAAFAIVDRVLFQPLPFHDPERLVQLAARTDRDGSSRTVSSVDVESWNDALARMATIAAYQVATVSVQDHGGFPDRVPAAHVTANLFTVLGRPPIIGHDFTNRDGRPPSFCETWPARRPQISQTSSDAFTQRRLTGSAICFCDDAALDAAICLRIDARGTASCGDISNDVGHVKTHDPPSGRRSRLSPAKSRRRRPCCGVSSGVGVHLWCSKYSPA